jgi:glycosyltransferase involved in cell wall biosynthesis
MKSNDFGKTPASARRILMITGDRALAQGKQGPFYYTLEEFSKYWGRIDIITPKVRNQESKIQNIFGNVFIHSSPWPLIFQPLFILKKGIEVFREQKFGSFTIHSYPPFYNDLGGIMLFRKIQKPYFLEVHHVTGYPRAGNFKESLYRFLTRIFIGRIAKAATAVRVVNKKQTPEFLIKSGVIKEKIKYIPSAYIDLEIFKPAESEKKYDAVFTGRLTENKGINLLLEAVKIIKASITNIKLVIVGSGPLESKIKEYIERENLQENIIFSGWLATVEDVAKIYNQSKIFVMPSLNEGGPRVNLEAMACRIPVITTRVGIMLDIIQDRENALFVEWDAKDIADKIMLLLKDNNLRKKIADNGYNTVRQFERKKVIKNYAETYQNLLHSSGI